MKKIWKIVSRVLLTVGLVLYVAVALLNYSVVQSVLGTMAGEYFSREWGGRVSIRSLHAMPFDHLTLDEVLLVAPDGDTVGHLGKVHVTFRRFPYHGHGLDLDHVKIEDAYYHLDVKGRGRLNLSYIIDYYKQRHTPSDKKHAPFTVSVRTAELKNVHYRMDLPDHRDTVYPYGVQIPHMEFFDIDGKIRDIRVVNADVTCRIVRFSTVERSGFRVRTLSGKVHVSDHDITAEEMHVTTDSSTIVAEGRLTYDGWSGMKDYLSTVQHEAVLKEGTRVAMSDVAYWAPRLWGISAEASAQGWVRGTIDSLTADLSVRWGRRSRAAVEGTIAGLPDIRRTEFNVDIERLHTTVEDMQPLIALARTDRQMQRLLRDVDHVDLDGSVRGSYAEGGTANVTVESGLGRVSTDVTMQNLRGSLRFSVEAGSSGLEMKALENEWLTRTGFDLSATGTWREGSPLMSGLEAEVEGHLTNTMEKGHHLDATSLSARMRRGTMNAEVSVADTLARFSLTAEARLADSLKSYDADIRVRRFDLGLLPRPLATHVTLSAEGNTLSTLSGHIDAENTHYGDLKVRHIGLTVDSDEDEKRLRLHSDLANATVSGSFEYEELPLMVRHFCQQYLPGGLVKDTPLDTTELAQLWDNQMTYSVVWNDDGEGLHSLVPSLTVARGTRVNGSYNFREQIKMVVRSDSVRVGPMLLDDVGIDGRPKNGRFSLQLRAQSVNLGSMQLLERADIVARLAHEQSNLELEWGDSESPSRGDLLFHLRGTDLTVGKGLFYVGKSRWALGADHMTLANEQGLTFVGEGINIESDDRRIGGRVQMRGLPSDCVELNFHRFNLGLISEMLLQGTHLNADGDINGRFSLYGLGQTPYFNANLTVDSCQVNNQHLGQVELKSKWNAEMNMLDLQLASQQVQASGSIGLGVKDPTLDFGVDFNSLELGMVAPLLESVSSRFEGQLHGSFDVGGTLANPTVNGEAYVENGVMKVDVTGVTYRFADSIQLSRDHITLDHFDIFDPLSNKATVNGAIDYSNLSLVNLDLSVKTDNMMLLNLPPSDQFYGKVLASADGRVWGNTNRLKVAVRARTNPGCEFTVPVSYRKQVKNQNYITFVSEAEEQVVVEKKRQSDVKIDLQVDLAITDNVKLNLPIDLDETKIDVSARGTGDLHLAMVDNQMPQVLGNYEIRSGTTKVGLLSLYEKNFTIENGSSLNFPGNVADARFDLRAVYSQRVNLSTLTGNLSSLDNTQKYIQVENVIKISGTMSDPHVGFDIRLPNADQSLEDEVFAYIDRNSERDMLTQTVSLLIGGGFANVNSDDGQTQAAGSALNSGIDVITSIVGNSLTGMVQFVDVNIDYKSATELTNQQLDVNISKDWGRWYLESTFGYGGESRELESSAANGAIIDALIGYRLSSLVHLFAYNRTNTNDYTRNDLPYKQGAGLKLTRDFDRWSDLFRRRKKIKK